MKIFYKVFILSFFCFLTAMTVGSHYYIKENKIEYENKSEILQIQQIQRDLQKIIEVEPIEPVIFHSLEEAYEKSGRINFILMGMEKNRTDSIIFISFCPNTKKANIINIPRDTYVHRKGFDSAAQRKINSVYQDHGELGLKKTVSHILKDIPINHIVKIDYEAVINIVDSMGGVEVDIPFPMKYRDPSADPPLNINLSSGMQILDGKNSLDFIRYRKGNNNSSGYIDGDIGRIKSQQEFIKSFITKASDNIITVLTKGFSHVKTDMSLINIISYGRKAIGMSTNDLEINILPGKSEFKKVGKNVLSYYIYDKEEIEELLKEMYNIKSLNHDTTVDEAFYIILLLFLFY